MIGNTTGRVDGAVSSTVERAGFRERSAKRTPTQSRTRASRPSGRPHPPGVSEFSVLPGVAPTFVAVADRLIEAVWINK
jgi:hypothetical protein